MTTDIKNKNGALWPSWLPKSRSQKLPESFLKAAGIIRNKAQRQSLERHVKKMRSEWR